MKELVVSDRFPRIAANIFEFVHEKTNNLGFGPGLI